MPKIIVTPELATTIKSLRVENKVPAKELATYIGKSPSYVSKFEKGEIKTIAQEEFDKIIWFVISDKASFQEKVNELLLTAKTKLSSEEKNRQLWFHNYSDVYCKIPISSDLIDDINQKMEEHGISCQYLVSRINANEFLFKEINSNPEAFEKRQRNEWFIRDDRIEILLDVSLIEIEEILTGKTTATGYVFMQAIVQYLLKLMRFKEQIELPDDTNDELRKDAIEYLSNFNFYTLSEKQKRIAEKKELSIFDSKNQIEKRKLMTFIQVLSDLDVNEANEILSAFNKNINWNGAFMRKIIALPFSDLGEVSFTFNQKLLNRIKALLQEAQEAPDAEKIKEQYT